MDGVSPVASDIDRWERGPKLGRMGDERIQGHIMKWGDEDIIQTGRDVGQCGEAKSIGAVERNLESRRPSTTCQTNRNRY